MYVRPQSDLRLYVIRSPNIVFSDASKTSTSRMRGMRHGCGQAICNSVEEFLLACVACADHADRVALARIDKCAIRPGKIVLHSTNSEILTHRDHSG